MGIAQTRACGHTNVEVKKMPKLVVDAWKHLHDTHEWLHVPLFEQLLAH